MTANARKLRTSTRASSDTASRFAQLVAERVAARDILRRQRAEAVRARAVERARLAELEAKARRLAEVERKRVEALARIDRERRARLTSAVFLGESVIDRCQRLAYEHASRTVGKKAVGDSGRHRWEVALQDEFIRLLREHGIEVEGA